MPTDSLYLLCRHDNLMNGFLCTQCLQEGIGGEGLCTRRDLCQHGRAWILERLNWLQVEKQLHQSKFLAFAMATHPRLGSKAEPPAIHTETTTRAMGKQVEIILRTVVESRHCVFAAMPADVVEKIWQEYVKGGSQSSYLTWVGA